jgi:hypothetical protein
MWKKNFENDNRRMARIILAHPDKFVGLPLIWARLWASAREEDMKGRAEHEDGILAEPEPHCWIDGCLQTVVAKAHMRTRHRVGRRWVTDPPQWTCEDHMCSERHWQLFLFPIK